MKNVSDGIKILPGSTNILVIAPHGPIINGKYENDIRTSIIAEEIHKRFGCYTIINKKFFKPKGPVKKNAAQYFLDLYRVDHSKKVSGYIDAIEDVVNSDGKTYVLWVHGIFDEFALDRGQEHMEIGRFNGPAESLHALIAYGQGGDPKTGNVQDSFSARRETIVRFRDLLTSGGMNTIFTHKKCNNYRGRDTKRFNQWFIRQGFSFDQVESIQLEIKESGFRNTKENAIKTAILIADALKKICIQE